MVSMLRRALILGVRRSGYHISACPELRAAHSMPDHLAKALDYREMYPDLLPAPDITRRNHVRESLELGDMLKRRTALDIPEFYVGTYMSITVSDKNAPGKKNKFVGICIQRKDVGLRHQVVLRNIVENEGVEITYDLYSPLILEIQVLRLEKRLDKDLSFLRDALPEFSTVPWNMEPEQHPEGSPVPINETKAIMKGLPWTQRWERKELKGMIVPFELSEKRVRGAIETSKPWEKYDLMVDYRSQIPLEEQIVIWNQVEKHRRTVEERHKYIRRRKLMQSEELPV
ncbi:39S ribosomal protein L19 [Tropilaelaps mercedesae]|uniref:Large ribosomal subunit protein bL19m n=1 Tax=Tropilaelaps mercedesae TaxID=418985 RepID=A0A1V9Y169_9ACAR|nr:39S ribosomal protein L19 [Tropilaelaps mercedesae]